MASSSESHGTYDRDEERRPPNLIQIAEQGFRLWADKPHNAKWVRRITGTPIENDLIVNMATAFGEAMRQHDLRVEIRGEKLEAVACPQCAFGLGGHEPGCAALFPPPVDNVAALDARARRLMLDIGEQTGMDFHDLVADPTTQMTYRFFGVDMRRALAAALGVQDLMASRPAER